MNKIAILIAVILVYTSILPNISFAVEMMESKGSASETEGSSKIEKKIRL